MCVFQCLETLTSRQMDMQLFIADGCKEALLEEKRRFCFLVDKHCMLSYQVASFHDKVRDANKRQGSPFTKQLTDLRVMLSHYFTTILNCSDLSKHHITGCRGNFSHLKIESKCQPEKNYAKTHHASCYHSNENVCTAPTDYSFFIFF